MNIVTQSGIVPWGGLRILFEFLQQNKFYLNKNSKWILKWGLKKARETFPTTKIFYIPYKESCRNSFMAFLNADYDHAFIAGVVSKFIIKEGITIIFHQDYATMVQNFKYTDIFPKFATEKNFEDLSILTMENMCIIM